MITSEQEDAKFRLEAIQIEETVQKDATVKMRRKPGKAETPEEAVARRKRINELKRQSKIRKLMRETPAERAIRKRNAAKHNREYRQKQRALKIPEKAAEIRLAKEEAAARRAAEIERKRKEKELMETPEVKAARRMQITNQVREHRKKQRALETPEQRTVRLAKAARRMRELRALQALEKRKLKEAEAILDKPANISEQIQQSSANQCDKEELKSTQISTLGTFPSGTAFNSPLKGATTKKPQKSESAKRRARNRDLRRMYRAMETPEESATRRARNRESMRKYRALETPEQAAERRAQNREKMRFYRNGGVSAQKTERVSNWRENCINRQGQTTIQFDANQNNSMAIKKEQLQDEWSIFECDETSFITQETLRSFTDIDIESTKKGKYQNKKFNQLDSKRIWRQKQLETNEDMPNIYEYIKMYCAAEAERDEYFVYGEYIATRLRTCNRGDSEIRKAKHLLQNIISYLNAGAYSGYAIEGTTGMQDDMASIPNIVMHQM